MRHSHIGRQHPLASNNNNSQHIKISGNHRVLILADTHIPFADNNSIRKAIDIGKAFKPDIVVLLGDIIDCVSISRFIKRIDERDFSREVKATRKFLEYVRNTFKEATFYYLEGNHEERISNYLLTHADALASLDELSLPSLLHLKELGIAFLPKDTTLETGKLTYTHGQICKGVCSIFPARALYLSAKTNAICGHSHRQSSYCCRALTGEVFRTYSVGCLSVLSPSYSVFNDFTSGCATVETDTKGNFEVNLKSF